MMNTQGSLDSSVVNTLGSPNSPVVNTLGNLDNPVINTPGSRLLKVFGKTSKGVFKKLAGDKKTGSKGSPVS